MTNIAINFEPGTPLDRYVARVLDMPEAEMTVSRAFPGVITVHHTGVPEALRGRGIGQALVAHLIDVAEADGLRIRALCSYARAQIERNPEWRRLLVD